jgi:hypothetical protein
MIFMVGIELKNGSQIQEEGCLLRSSADTHSVLHAIQAMCGLIPIFQYHHHAARKVNNSVKAHIDAHLRLAQPLHSNFTDYPLYL